MSPRPPSRSIPAEVKGAQKIAEVSLLFFVLVPSAGIEPTITP